MSRVVTVTDFAEWRAACRGLLAVGVLPGEVLFTDAAEPGLFAAVPPPTVSDAPDAAPDPTVRVPKAFVELAETVAHHRDPARWGHLYRAVWRLTQGEPHLLALATDDLVAWLHRAEKAVRRDAHKMKAFVRFRGVGDHFVAWHRPDHRIVRLVAPFFRRRFPEMYWTILTPDESVTWDGAALVYGPGVPASAAPPPDVLEDLWRAYYRSTFNPARIKITAMKKELPVRHWPTLPETADIPALLAEAPERVAAMVAHAEGFARSAAAFLPERRDLVSLRQAAAGCTACGLCQRATQTVFGEGPADARLVLVGEQPGDEEDIAGRPFVGPAGQVLDAALKEAGLDRAGLYLTNVVKHFKFQEVTDDSGWWFRQHHRADAREQEACRPWLAAELATLDPAVVVCLGATAARAVLGPLFRFAERRGEPVPLASGATAIATYHPSAVLRGANPDAVRADLTAHLRRAGALVGGLEALGIEPRTHGLKVRCSTS